MIGRIHSIGWVSRNESLILIAAAFFIANQIFEVLAINLFRLGYDYQCNWDCGWYKGIVEWGYDLEPHGHEKGDAANWAFFPVLPMVARALGFLLGSTPGTSLVITSKVFFLLSIFAFLKFAKAYRPGLDPLIPASVIAFNPYSIYGNVGYTEPLFLLLTCVFFYLLKHGNVLAAGVAGAFLTASRVVGVVTIASYLYTLWRERPRGAREYERALLGLLLIPLGLVLFMTFLYYHTGDALAFSHIQRAWGRSPGNPFVYLYAAFKSSPVEKYFAVMSALALLVPVYFAWKRNIELALFTLGCTLIPLSTAIWSMPRYIWWQAPILLAVALLLTRRIMWIMFIATSTLGLTFSYFSWFSGKGLLT
ncbi:hypothetical protein ACSUZJ_04880 [Telluria sp. B2]